jgi:hypothetical protein
LEASSFSLPLQAKNFPPICIVASPPLDCNVAPALLKLRTNKSPAAFCPLSKSNAKLFNSLFRSSYYNFYTMSSLPANAAEFNPEIP